MIVKLDSPIEDAGDIVDAVEVRPVLDRCSHAERPTFVEPLHWSVAFRTNLSLSATARLTSADARRILATMHEIDLAEQATDRAMRMSEEVTRVGKLRAEAALRLEQPSNPAWPWGMA